MSTWTLKEKSTGELKVTIEGENWKTAQTKAFNKLAKELEIPGFRKGSVPAAMAKKYVPTQKIMLEAVEHCAQDLLDAGIEEHSLWPISRPELNVEEISEEAATMSFTFAIKPEVKLGEYKGLAYEVEETSVSEEEVEAELKRIQENFAELEVKEDGEVENGDTAVIDFEGFKDGVAFEGGKGENYPLEIGSNSFIPGFEEQVIGMKKEETKDINVTFPENYQAAELAGQPVVFKVTVHEIKGAAGAERRSREGRQRSECGNHGRLKSADPQEPGRTEAAERGKRSDQQADQHGRRRLRSGNSGSHDQE